MGWGGVSRSRGHASIYLGLRLFIGHGSLGVWSRGRAGHVRGRLPPGPGSTAEAAKPRVRVSALRVTIPDAETDQCARAQDMACAEILAARALSPGGAVCAAPVRRVVAFYREGVAELRSDGGVKASPASSPVRCSPSAALRVRPPGAHPHRCEARLLLSRGDDSSDWCSWSERPTTGRQSKYHVRLGSIGPVFQGTEALHQRKELFG